MLEKLGSILSLETFLKDKTGYFWKHRLTIVQLNLKNIPNAIKTPLTIRILHGTSMIPLICKAGSSSSAA